VARGPNLFRSLYWRALQANLVGAAIAFVYLAFVAPPRPEPAQPERLLYLAVALYVAGGALLAYRLGKRRWAAIERWLAEDRPPTEAERRRVLRLPWTSAGRSAIGWAGAALLACVVTATHHPAPYVVGTTLGIVLAGLSTAAVTFLLTEQALRPLLALALPGGPPGRGLGTRSRLVVSWALGSGVALVAIAVAFLGRGDDRAQEVLAPVLFLVVAGLFAGGVLVSVAARSVADPLHRVRAALERVEQGSLDEELVVDDGGEIGVLQAGFNRMVAGLRERERIRDAFGTYVDREVAEHILREGTSLEGEEVEVTVMFLDVRDFTAFAERASAAEVVAVLNRLFERVVPVIHDHGGHVDKYVGDGLLAVFGAPRRQDDHADRAVGAARAIAAAVEAEFTGELAIGVGLNSGTVIVGNVGGGGRLEFSVIGDAVNVAARVEAATRQTGDPVLVSERTRALLSGDVAASLQPRPAMPLRGRSEPVALFALPSSGDPRAEALQPQRVADDRDA
jgi:adenylate cyclase